MDVSFTPELLSALAGIVLSLLFSYVPGLKDWFEKQEPDYKRLIMLGVLGVTAGGIYAASCYELWEVVACGDWKSLVEIFVVAAIANQSAYALSPRAH